MSVIDKKPFINSVLESLTTEQVASLKQLINGQGAATVFRSLIEGSPAKLTATDKGVAAVKLELSGNPAQTVYDGYLIYNNTYCVLVAYSGEKNQQLTLIEMEQNAAGIWSYQILPCEISILELRSELDDSGDAAEIVGTVNEAIADGRIVIPAGMEIVELSSSSGTLTDEEFEKVSGDNCIIKLIADYYYKKEENSNYLVYHRIGFGSETSGEVRINIVKENKYYSLATMSVSSVYANPILSGSEGALTGLQVGSTKYKVGGSELDADVTVEIESDYTNDDYQNRTNYATPISLADFISNCENGTYTNPGTIAKINNLIDKKAFRVLLIGTNIDVLAYDNTTTVKNTWQFLDMPEHSCRLGLPFNIIDWGTARGRAAANTYLDGTNESWLSWYPSNKGGYVTAVGLLNALHTIYEGLPMQLKRAIKTVRKAFSIPRAMYGIEEHGGGEYETNQTGYIAQKLFHLSATENNISGYGTEGTAYDYLNSLARRIRYYNNAPSDFWLRSVNHNSSAQWVNVNSLGAVFGTNSTTAEERGVAPGFCI